MSTPSTIEGYPEVTTMGVAWQIASGPTWLANPMVADGWVQHGSAANASLGAPIAVTTSTVLAKGTWVIATATPTAQIVVSDGTTPSPVAGEAYPLTVV